MDARLVVIIAGIILMVAIIGALIVLRKNPNRFVFDTQGGTRPRASEGEGNTASTAFKGRFNMLMAGAASLFGILLAKLWTMQMVSSDYYEKKAQSNQTRTITTPAPRGRILDRNGIALVTNRGSLVVSAYQSLASDTVLVRHLANVLGLPYVTVHRNIQDYSQGAQSLHSVATDVRRSTVAYIQEHAGEFPGVHIVERTERLYPYGETCAHVLGYTGSITSDQLEKQTVSDANDETGGTNKINYQSGDIVGQAGVESAYEELLQGIRGEQTVSINASGAVTGVVSTVPPHPGSDIKLTIDLKTQQACEQGLEKAVSVAREHGNKADGGACICMDATNGEILGMASYPQFDPSVFIGGISTDLWNEFNADDGSRPLIDRAIAGQYVSASTIKPLGALAGMEYGVYSSSRSTDCTGYWTGLGKSNGKWCWLHSGHGPQNLQQGITNSCDSVFYDVGKAFYYDKDNPEGLQEMYRRWGLGKKTGIDLAGEADGRVPDRKWKQSHFKNWSSSDRAWNAGDMTNIAIGQGDILVTPLQMSCVYAGIANGGVEYTPHVFLSAVSDDGTSDVFKYNNGKRRRRLKAHVNSAADMKVVKRGLYGVIYEESGSTASHFSNLPVTVAGKTGTGEKSGEDAFGWLCVYAPADKPKYVVASLIEHGGYGASSALYAVRTVLGSLYDCPDSSMATGDESR